MFNLSLFGLPNISTKLGLGLIAGGLGLLGLGYLGVNSFKAGSVEANGSEIAVVVSGVPPGDCTWYDLLEVYDLGILTEYSTLPRRTRGEPQGYALRCRRCDSTSSIRSAIPSQGALLFDASDLLDLHKDNCPLR